MTVAVVLLAAFAALLVVLVRAGSGRRLGGSTHDRFWGGDE